MVPPVRVGQLEALLKQQQLTYSRSIDNVQTILEPMWEAIDERGKAGRVFDINDFNTLSDIYGWMLALATECRPGLTCQVYNVGNSHNGNPILVFRMYQATAGRMAYWIDGTIHGREWIATATVLKVIDAMAQGTNAEAVRLTNAYDWYIMPVMNPDGYDYTWSNDRLWRKNRKQNPGTDCIGTDINRNFNFRWGIEGVSHNPCSEIYCGPSGASEPETEHVQNELIRLGPTLLATVTVQSYGNLWTFPWGNTLNHAGAVCDLAADNNDLMAVADRAANAIQATYATSWARGNSCVVNDVDSTTGCIDDFSKGGAGVKYAFSSELRGDGFVIESSEIVPSFNEFFHGIIAMADAISA